MEFVILYFGGAVVLGVIASLVGESGIKWFFIGLFLSVILGLILLLIVKAVGGAKSVVKHENEKKDLLKEVAHGVRGADNDDVNKIPAVLEWTFDRDLENDAYKIYLTKKYKLEKNDVLGKIISAEKAYESVEQALTEVHRMDVDSAIARLKKLTSPDYVRAQGKIGRNSYDYTEYGDGKVVAKHPSGFVKEFTSIAEARRYFGE